MMASCRPEIGLEDFGRRFGLAKRWLDDNVVRPPLLLLTAITNDG